MDATLEQLLLEVYTSAKAVAVLTTENKELRAKLAAQDCEKCKEE